MMSKGDNATDLEIDALRAQLAAVGEEFMAARQESSQLRAQLLAVGAELKAAREETLPLRNQLQAVGQERGEEITAARQENLQLRDQLLAVGAELKAAREETQPLRNQLRAVDQELEVERRRNLALEAMLDGRRPHRRTKRSSQTRPSVLFNALPKSASTYCFEVLRRAGSYHEGMVTAALFPFDILVWRRYYAFAEGGGQIAHHHLGATPVNLWLLRQRPVRMFLHVRDPRQAMISWLHHLARHDVREIPPLTTLSPPPEWFDQTKSKQLDWLIDHHLPVFVQWIEDWIVAIDRNEADALITTFEAMAQDPTAFFARLADYCGVDRKLVLERPDPRDDSLFQFRAGRVDEWRDIFTAKQAKRVRTIVPSTLLDRLGWPR